MKVLVNTDHNIDCDADEVDRIESAVQSAFGRFDHHLTRIEVHLRDESAGKESVDDIRCLLEARPTGQDPVVVIHHGDSVTAAFGGATDKLDALLTSKLDRRREHKGGDTIRGAARPSTPG